MGEYRDKVINAKKVQAASLAKPKKMLGYVNCGHPTLPSRYNVVDTSELAWAQPTGMLTIEQEFHTYGTGPTTGFDLDTNLLEFWEVCY